MTITSQVAAKHLVSTTRVQPAFTKFTMYPPKTASSGSTPRHDMNVIIRRLAGASTCVQGAVPRQLPETGLEPLASQVRDKLYRMPTSKFHRQLPPGLDFVLAQFTSCDANVSKCHPAGPMSVLSHQPASLFIAVWDVLGVFSCWLPLIDPLPLNVQIHFGIRQPGTVP